MSATVWNIIVWVAPGWLFYFCVIEAPAAFKAQTERWFGWRVPWDTFSRFIWDAQARWDFLAVAVAALFGILFSHLLRGRSIEEGDRPSARQQIVDAKVRRAQAVLDKHGEQA